MICLVFFSFYLFFNSIKTKSRKQDSSSSSDSTQNTKSETPKFPKRNPSAMPCVVTRMPNNRDLRRRRANPDVAETSHLSDPSSPPLQRPSQNQKKEEINILLMRNKTRKRGEEIGSLQTWTKTKIQNIVSKTSIEAKYRALAIVICELQWLPFLLHDLHPSTLTLLYYNNQSTHHITHNLSFHEHMEHIAIDCHMVREKIQSNLLHLLSIQTNKQVADDFTKFFNRT